MSKIHVYNPITRWTGNKGSGTVGYRSYDRSHTILIEGKPDILASSDASFRGDESRHNPEDLFVSSIAGCHMLWYLHLCSDNGVVVLSYEDRSQGEMTMNKDGSGQFKQVILRPQITISSESSIEMATAQHKDAHRMCFIANSCNFPILCEPTIIKE